MPRPKKEEATVDVEANLETSEEGAPLDSSVDQAKALKALDASLKKKYGDNYYGLTKKMEPVEFITSGCASLDYVCGGGIPVGRILEIFGTFSSGKSLIAMTVIKAWQELGKVCAWVDAEAAWSSEFAEMCGVDENRMVILQPETSEEALNFLRDIVASGVVSLVVLDSIA